MFTLINKNFSIFFVLISSLLIATAKSSYQQQDEDTHSNEENKNDQPETNADREDIDQEDDDESGDPNQRESIDNILSNTNVRVTRPSQQIARHTNPDTKSNLGEDLEAEQSHYHVKKSGKKNSGWLDMGAWSGGKGSFGWYADFPVGRRRR